MPFDVADFPGASSEDRAASWRSRRQVSMWLFVIAAMVLVMTGIGGLTRLTGSGLSIMEWAPIMGALPPVTDAEWERLFALYKQIPQFALVNADFLLTDFKRIFWLEWVHRLWGRVLGLAFVLPLMWFWVKGHVPLRLALRLLAFFALGGLQGAVGWFMVASGFFPDTTTVSAYRLVLHLGLAMALYVGILWTGLTVFRGTPSGSMLVRRTHVAALVTTVLVIVTVLAGGFVAGIKAGLTFNTFPLMDGGLVPDGYADLTPFLRNLTENVATVQFNHRLLATITLVACLATAFIGLRVQPAALAPWAPLTLGGMVIVQYALGIATLLYVVPVALAVLHQLCALLVLTAVLILLHMTRGSGPEERERR